MRVRQHLQRVVVLGVDDRVERLVAAPLDTARLYQTGVDAIPELRDDHYVVGGHRADRGLLGVQLREMGQALSVGSFDPRDAPQWLVAGLRLPTRRKHAHLVAASHRPAGQLDSLGLMLLEDEAEGAALSERGDLCFQISTELRISLVRLPQQLRQSRQWCALLVRTDAN